MTSKQAFDLIATNCAMNCKKPLDEECNKDCDILNAFKVIRDNLLALEILKDCIYIKQTFSDTIVNERYVIKINIPNVSANSDNLKWVKEVIENDTNI